MSEPLDRGVGEVKYFLGIDVGTSESKAVLIDENYLVVSMASVPHGLLNPQPGYFEHDAEKVWWGDCCRLIHRILDESRIRPDRIAAVGCSALGADLVPVDEQCRPLRNAILYGIDSRAYEEIEYLNEKYGKEKVLEFNGRPLCSNDIPPKMLWLKKHEPEIFDTAYKLLTASSFLTAKLTGNFTIDRFLAYGPFAPLYSKKDGQPDMEYVLDFCRPDQLAGVKETVDIAGYVTEKASEECGLCEGTPIITGTDDAAAEAVSTGVAEPGDLMLMLGSSLYMIGICPKMVKDTRIWPGGFLMPGQCCVQGGTNAAGTLTKWYRDEIFGDYFAEEQKGGRNAFSRMSEEAGEVPPGAEGLVHLPYLAGERTPVNDPDAKGMIFGLTLKHTRKHLYRAAMESVGYTIRQHLEIFAENGIDFKRIYAVGGGTKSPVWLQIIADITGQEIYKTEVSVGASYGDALLAAMGSGYLKDLAQIRSLAKIGQCFFPDPVNKGIYEKYQQIYNDLYARTKDLMHRI